MLVPSGVCGPVRMLSYQTAEPIIIEAVAVPGSQRTWTIPCRIGGRACNIRSVSG
jgi:hypothetical protein